MPESFGGRLRERREHLAIALATIAQETKIKASLLDGLEHDDLSHWPSGIFRRAYVRSYAAAIGLNPDVVLQEFLALYPDRPDRFAAETVSPPAPDGGPAHAPPTRLRYLLGSAMGSFTPRRHAAAAPPTPAPAPVETRLAAEPPPMSILHSPKGADAPEVPSEPAPAPTRPDLARVAELCTAFGRVENVPDLECLLEDARVLLGATGLVVWIWDEPTAELRPALAAGYPEKVRARLRAVTRDADNATAEAFRSARPSCVNGALVVPIVIAAGCAGVLAMELSGDGDPPLAVQGAAGIIAALFALLVGPTAAEPPSPRLATASPRSSSDARSTAAL